MSGSADGREVLLRAQQVEQFYDRRIRILGPLDLDVHDGEFLTLVGPSGCGKSTLLRIVAGLLEPTAGSIEIGGVPLVGVNRDAAMVFQSFALFPWMSVVENVALGLEARGMPPLERLKRAEKYIDLVGLSGYERAFPKELSRGMKQLVGLARALALEPELLCMDEPFSALDVLTARAMRDLVLDLWQSPAVKTKSILLVTHSIEEAVALSDRVVVLRANPGRIAEVVDLTGLARPRRPGSAEVSEVVDRMYGLLA
ncbi:MAG: ABC transporter ATP-binding protein [Vicinamibacteria bacterium]|jgi:NitT/TauT family transport system ATP-binding protein|nr:ABC transporter ATP-binding protein [Vicinamibacteria bacterium]